MPQDVSQSQASIALATGTVGSASTAPRATAIARPSWLRLPRLAFLERPLAARLALGSMLFGTLLVVAFATAGQNILVPASYLVYPPWQSGPLHLIFRWLPIDQNALKDLLTFVVLMMLGAWGIALKARAHAVDAPDRRQRSSRCTWSCCSARRCSSPTCSTISAMRGWALCTTSTRTRTSSATSSTTRSFASPPGTT